MSIRIALTVATAPSAEICDHVESMPFEIDQKLVVAIASSALFDLGEADRVFTERGEDAYREYQRKHENEVLKPGVASAFIKRLLSFNLSQEDSPVEVILLSRNDPDTGLRVFNSIEACGLGITRAAFLNGSAPFRYIPGFSASIFLSANARNVEEAILTGHPAGRVLDSVTSDDPNDVELRIAFDFDGVLADETAEQVFQTKGLDAFHQSEADQAHTPHGKGPLHELFVKIAQLQELDRARVASSTGYVSRIKVAIITSRNAPAHKRVVTSLRKWRITVDQAFFLGGMDKSRILAIFRPHVFFDDQKLHLKRAREIAPCVHVPWALNPPAGT